MPTDPCICRFYEIVGVYGPTRKALIHEKFGDGIGSVPTFAARCPNDSFERCELASFSTGHSGMTMEA